MVRCSIRQTTPNSVVSGTRVRRWHLHRRLYDWVLHWADTPYGTPALFCLAFAESSFFPVPPDVLLIALALGSSQKALRFALWCSIASVVGGLLGYYIGYGPLAYVGQKIASFYGREELLSSLREEFGQRGVLWVFLAGFTPIPYKIFTIAAGMAKMHLGLFVLASAVSRSARFFLVAWLIWQFGPRIKPVIDRYFNLLCVIFAVLLVGGFLAIKYIRGH